MTALRQQTESGVQTSLNPVIAAHFDKAASSYVCAAALQQQVALDLAAVLPATAPQQCRVLLDVGCGPGWYHPQLIKHCSELWAVDLSAAMLAQAQTLGCASRYLQADVCQIPIPDHSVDLIFSSLMLQWCATPKQAFQELCRVLKPGGTMLLSTLVQGSLAEFQQSWAGVDDDVHQLQLLATTEVLAQFQNLGVAVGSQERQYQVFYPDVWALARGFKQIGANFVQGRQGQGLMGKQRWLAFANNYEQYRGARGLPLSYQVLQLVVTKPASLDGVTATASIEQDTTA
jgi:malonyl-CoA O-methyltransferase